MKYLGHLARTALAASLLAGGSLAALPASAAPADVALIKSYIGDWRGRGVIIGENQETVVCRLSLTEGNNDKVNYSGRCTLAGTQLSVAGTIAYIEASRQYEAAMSTNATFTGTAVGKKRGSNLVFNLRDRETDEEGKPLNISAQIVLKDDAMQVDFDVVYVETGDNLHAEVPFTR